VVRTRRSMLRMLSAAQVDRFHHDGYLVLERFVPDARCDALRARAEAMVQAFEPGALRSVFTTDEQARKTDDYFLDSGEEIRFFFEEHAFDAQGNLRVPKERSINKIGHGMHDLDPEFDRFSRDGAIAALVSDLGVSQPRLMQSMYIFKQPHIGGEVKCHQDSTFLHTEPESLLGLWFALEDAHRGNGCLWGLPGGHRAGLKSRFVRDPDRTTRFETLDAAPWDEEKLVPLEVPKGSVIVLDGLVPHMSRANDSDTSRHAYTLHVVSAASAYPETNWLRRKTPARGF
jgi:phytanoyl-CoA hydroxylase